MKETGATRFIPRVGFHIFAVITCIFVGSPFVIGPLCAILEYLPATYFATNGVLTGLVVGGLVGSTFWLITIVIASSR